jgi:hypothetical protein
MDLPIKVFGGDSKELFSVDTHREWMYYIFSVKIDSIAGDKP